MTVDLYTDAGLKNGVGTWAFVLVVPGVEPIEASGRFRKDGLACAITAELRTIANALHRLKRSGYVVSGTEVRVITDCKHAVERIKGQSFKRTTPRMAEALAAIEAQAVGLVLIPQWVKGHQPENSTDPRAVWNRRCDALATKARALPRPTTARRHHSIAKKLMGAAT